MGYSFRPAVRENTPLIIGIAGPTKSGKTYSALRLGTGVADGRPVAMINAEGPRGHQYAERFTYLACDLVAPFRPSHYTQAIQEAAKLGPGAIIIDSGSHMWDGPGGVLEWHEEELDRIAGDDYKKRERSTWAAWVKPKADENAFIYAMLAMTCPVILCLRAKEKIKLVKGQDPIDLGWQPIVGERVAFETLFTLTLPPFAAGVPDLAISFMREPFDTLVPAGKPIDETLGESLAAWARGGATRRAGSPPDDRAALLAKIQATITRYLPGQDERAKRAKAQVLERVFGVKGWAAVEALPAERLRAAVEATDLTAPSRLETACADFRASLTAA